MHVNYHCEDYSFCIWHITVETNYCDFDWLLGEQIYYSVFSTLALFTEIWGLSDKWQMIGLLNFAKDSWIN